MSQIDNIIIGGSGNDTLIGTAGNDLINGGLGDDELYGGAGDDTLVDDGYGSDGLWGGAGNDTYQVSFGSQAATGGPDLYNINHATDQEGEGNADTLVFTNANFSDLVFTQGYHGFRPDHLYIHHTPTNKWFAVSYQFSSTDPSSTAGIENFVFADGTSMTRTQLVSVVNGGNFIPGTTVTGTAGDDDISGSPGNDTMNGGDGDDTFHCSPGADIYIGGSGTDTVVYTLSPGSVAINMVTGTGSGAYAESDTLVSIEKVVGSNYGDTFIASGPVTLQGGDGDDIYILDGPDVVVSEQVDGGTDTVKVSLGSYVLGTNVENLVYTGNGNFVGTGNQLDNTITGGSGHNTIDSGDGNDLLLNCGCGGTNVFIGGAGRDTVSYVNMSGGVSVNLVTGIADTGGGKTDTLSSIEVIIGSHHADTLIASGTAELQGGAGNDVYEINSSEVIVIEEEDAGTDTVKVSGISSYTLTANVENLIYQGTGNFVGVGNDLNNVMIGGDGNDSLNGGAGDDVLVHNGLGIDALSGGLGNDTYQFTFGNDVVIGAPEPSNLDQVTELEGEGSADTLVFADANFADLEFTQGYDGLGLSNLYVRRLGTNQVVVINSQFASSNPFSTAGIETFVFSDGTSITRSDVLSLVAGGTTLIGTSGDDILLGGGGNDTLLGGDGNDVLIGGQGTDVLNGGDGTDTASYLGSSSGVSINLATGTGSGGDAHGDTLFSIEAVIGSDHNDTFTAPANGGTFTLQGGKGNDTYVVNGQNVIIVEEAGEGIDTVQVGGVSSFTLDDNVENLTHIGCVFGGFIGTGNALDNVMEGSECDDVFYGLGGNDTLSGKGGNDTLYGGNGNDTLIHDGSGIDGLWGGAGNDTYIFNFGSEIVVGPPNLYALNHVTDLEAEGSSDTLVLADAKLADLKFMQGYYGFRPDHLYILNTTTNKVLGVSYQFSSADPSSTAGIETIVFADGTSISRTDIAGLIDNNPTGNSPPGTAGDDTLYGTSGSDILSGGLGSDTLYGFGGDDILIHDGKGNDGLWGGAGNDTYMVAFGSEVVYGSGLYRGDHVTDLEGEGSADTLVFTDANLADLQFMQGYYGSRPDHLYIRNKITNEVLGVSYQFSSTDPSSTAGIETFVFADGTVISRNDILGIIDNTPPGIISIGTIGNDTINGSIGNDTLSGCLGNDTIYAGSGDDIMIHDGKGIDGLWGGTGNDTYRFAFGDEVISVGSGVYLGDHVTDLEGEGNSDTLVFTDANFEDLEFMQGYNGISPDHLYVRDTISNKIMAVSYQFASTDPGATAGIETFIFADGSAMSKADLLLLV